MHRLGWGCALLAAVTLAPPAPAAQPAVATVAAGRASLGNGRVERTWTIDAAGHVLAAGLEDRATGTQWARPAPDFRLTLDELPTSSASGWSLAGVSAGDAGRAARLAFRYALLPTGPGPELTRTFTLHPGAAVVESQTTLENRSPLPLRIGLVTLEQIAGAKPAQAEVLAFHGGSDWRDDYREIAHPAPGAFDREGEVARYGGDEGFFEVSGHRGGAMYRAGRAADGTTYLAIDWPRDAFDFGPLKTDPPDYNRLENPAYPVPVRERLVAPGGTLDLGQAFTGVYHGGAQEAGVAFTRDFAAHVAPRFDRSIGANTFHPFSHGPGMSDPNLRAQVDRAAELGIESYMLDDQWQGGPGGESGDWHFDPARFPDADHDGTPDFVTYVHDKGLKLGLWMSPLEFNGASTTFAAHPDWACTPIGQVTAQIEDDAGLGVWDVTNPGLRAHLLGVVDRLVRDYDVREFKFDFMAWVDCPPHDYLDYEDAFVSLVREMERRHPGVTFELDETNDQRSWPFESAALGPSWFDNAHVHAGTKTSKLLHDLWSAAPWLPTSEIGVGALDDTLTGPHTVDELMPIALLSHITFWTDLTKLGPGDATGVKRWLDWYRAHRATLAGAAYELTAGDPLDGRTWAAFEPWRARRGVLFAFRQESADATQTFAIRGVRAATTYDITDARTGALVAQRTGAQLAQGLDVTLGPDGAAVLQIDPEA